MVRSGVVVVLFIFMWNFRISGEFCSLPCRFDSADRPDFPLAWYLNQHDDSGRDSSCHRRSCVDDSIVDIENIVSAFERESPEAEPFESIQVIYDASCEVRNSIVFATLIVVLVVLPLFLHGRT